VAGAWGACATLIGSLLPSTLLTLWIARWGDQRRDSRGLRAFTTGMAPLTLGLLAATGWILAEPVVREPSQRVGALFLVAATIGLMTRTKISPMWLVALGAAVGVVGAI
jgi:chromate transporter